jgi:hypothetical protein
MLKMVISIDDLTPETKRVLTVWGQSQNIQVKELRECRWFSTFTLFVSANTYFSTSGGNRESQPGSPNPGYS